MTPVLVISYLHLVHEHICSHILHCCVMVALYVCCSSFTTSAPCDATLARHMLWPCLSFSVLSKWLDIPSCKRHTKSRGQLSGTTVSHHEDYFSCVNQKARVTCNFNCRIKLKRFWRSRAQSQTLKKW